MLERLVRTSITPWRSRTALSSSRRCYHNSRWQSEKEITKQSKDLHHQMTQVMGAKRAPAASDQTRKTRVRQSVINMGVSFMTVVLAGQALKSGSERRKMETKMYEAVEETEQKTQLLKNLSSEEVIRELAQKVSNSVEAPPNDRSWFRFQTRIKNKEDQSLSTEERIYQVLQTELSLLLGDADQSAAERDRSHLEKLQHEELSLANQQQQLLNEEQQHNHQEIERARDGETVIKKRVLRM